MRKFAYCETCPAIRAMEVMEKEYEFFLEVADNGVTPYLPDHARGHHQGKIQAVKDFLSDLSECMVFSKREVELKPTGNPTKGKRWG